MKKIWFITLLALFLLAGCKQDEINTQAGLFTRNLSELHSEKLKAQLVDESMSLVLEDFYHQPQFNFDKILFVKEVLSQPFEIGKKSFSDNDTKATIKIEYRTIDVKSLEDIKNRQNPYPELVTMIARGKKTQRIIIELPMVLVKDQWRVDINQKTHLYLPLFEPFDQLNLWPKGTEFIPF